MKRFIIESDVFRNLPDLNIAVLTIDNIINGSENSELILNLAQDNVMKRIGRVEGIHPHIETYKEVNDNYLYSMVKSIQEGDKINTSIPVVDINNSISLNYLISSCGIDKDYIYNDIILGTKDESCGFLYRNGDGELIIDLINKSNINYKIKLDTRSAIFFMMITDGKRVEELKFVAQEWCALMEKELKATCGFTVLSRDVSEHKFD